MIRLLVLYSEPIDVAAFERHYWEVHIPLAKKLSGLLRYTVSRNMRPLRGDKAYYLVGELDWDDAASMQAAFQSPEGQATAQDVTDHLDRLSPGVRSMIYELEEA